MPLIDLNWSAVPSALPADVRSFLREATKRIRRFQQNHHVPGFVASDYRLTYHALHALTDSDQVTGDRFCEWGSGFGVVACVAAMLGFNACGVEIEGILVDGAQQLADDFGLPAEFLTGSFIPQGRNIPTEGFSWLTTREDANCDDSGLNPADFDVIFAYPWPDEEAVVEELFEHDASEGAILMTYHEVQEMRIRKKVRK